MAGFDVIGAEQLKVLGAQLKVADRTLRLEMGREIRKAAAPLVAEIRASAREELPKSGGLAERVAGSQIGIRINTAGRSVGVRVQAKNAMSIARMNKGSVRHPVFGNRQAWVTQELTPGWFDKPTIDNPELKVQVQAGIKKAMDETARRLTA